MQSSSITVAVEAAAQGSADAFEDLYAEYAGPLQGYVRKTIGDPDHAEDVCQEIWLKAYSALKTLRYPEAFSSWLYQLALHTSLSERRKRHRRDVLAPVVSDPESIDVDGNAATHADWSPQTTEPDPLRALLTREEAALAWEALASLPPRQHHALYLREVEDYSYQEIAHETGASPSAVESLLVRARRGFLDAYRSLENDPEAACARARALDIAIGSGEATIVQRKALELHRERCPLCRPAPTGLRKLAGLLGLPLGWGSSLASPALPLLRAKDQLTEIVLHFKGWIALGAAIGLVATAATTVPGLVAHPGSDTFDSAAANISAASSIQAENALPQRVGDFEIGTRAAEPGQAIDLELPTGLTGTFADVGADSSGSSRTGATGSAYSASVGAVTGSGDHRVTPPLGGAVSAIAESVERVSGLLADWSPDIVLGTDLAVTLDAVPTELTTDVNLDATIDSGDSVFGDISTQTSASIDISAPTPSLSVPSPQLAVPLPSQPVTQAPPSGTTKQAASSLNGQIPAAPGSGVSVDRSTPQAPASPSSLQTPNPESEPTPSAPSLPAR